MMTLDRTCDLVVFSHLRWDFVFQRPQHLLTRCARERCVYFVEEPVFESRAQPILDISPRKEGVFVAVPRLPEGLNDSEVNDRMKRLVDDLFADRVSRRHVLWYYTPMALKFTRHLKPMSVVYDCMDELSNFKLAPPELRMLEDDLFRVADVVFTGGISLYEAKRAKHPNVHPFPSSVDVAHFAAARGMTTDSPDQAHLPRPRIGYAGVIDERFDVELVRGVAELKPDWHLVLVGPVVKIDPASLPRLPNIHYLGAKPYAELPQLMGGWDVALLPFARNEATRFISPTKTPEYLAAGRRVVSTSIRDVVRTYGTFGLVHIADHAADCVQAISHCLNDGCTNEEWYARADELLARSSWDTTYRAMWHLIEESVRQDVPVRKSFTAISTPALPAPSAVRPVPKPAFSNVTSAG